MTKPIHPCAWASHKGRELKLSCPERVTLWQLAERAATKGFCFPSIVQLMDDTGLARQTVIETVRALERLGLIVIEKVLRKGKLSHTYTVLSAVQNKTGHRSKSRPDTGLKEDREVIHNQSNSGPVSGLKTGALRSKNTPICGLKEDPNLKLTKKEPTPPSVGVAPEGGREPENSNSDSGKRQASVATPQPVPKAPTIGPASDGSGAYQPPKPDVPFDEWIDKGAPDDGALSMHCEVEAGEVDEDTPIENPEDQARMAAQLAALAHQVARGFFNNYPPRKPQLTPEEQIAVVGSKPALPDVAFSGSQLAAFRGVPQEPQRTPQQQMAELLGISLADAEQRMVGVPP